MKITRKQLRQIIKETLEGVDTAGREYRAEYDVDQYLPGFQKAVQPLKGFTSEFMQTDFGRDTDLIRQQMSKAMNALFVVESILSDSTVEYKKGPFGGYLKPASQTMDTQTGDFRTSPSKAMDSD